MPKVDRLRVSPFINCENELDNQAKKDLLIKSEPFWIPEQTSQGCNKAWLKMLLKDEITKINMRDMNAFLLKTTKKNMALRFPLRVPQEIERLNKFLASLGMKSIGFENVLVHEMGRRG